MEKRGKDTPLSEMPKLNLGDQFYLSIIMRLRKMTAPITMQDLSSYCQMFTVPDKARLIEIVAQVNQLELKNGN
jgi:hypothetical protein